MATPAAISPDPHLKHPPGLYALFAAEMWERFSYYGMRALLVLYLVKRFGMERSDALGVYAVYTGLVYLTPLIGGRLADRYLGQRKAVFIGGILMALGQFALTQPSLLNLGLGLLIIGNGFFKPNISTMVGGLYPAGDVRRDGAYTIFYMGINLGAFLAPLACGPLGEKLGWWPGFVTAGVGMSLGLLCFGFTQRLLQGVGLPPGRPAVDRAVLGARDYLEIVMIAAVCAAGVFGALQIWPQIEPLWSPLWLGQFAPRDPKGIHFAAVAYKGAVLIFLLGLFLWLTESRTKAIEGTAAADKLTAEDWQRVAVIFVISLFSIIFWMGFEQSGGTLNLFADEKTNRNVLGWEVPASVLQAVNPMFIILLSPVFAAVWTALARRNFPLPNFAKQGMGLILLGVAFIVMYFADASERPTSEFRPAFDAARHALTPEAAAVRLLREDKPEEAPTVGKTLDDAAKVVQDGELPFKALDNATKALEKAGQTDSLTPLNTAFEIAKTSRVSPLWLIAVYFILTVAELLLSPIGLSLVNKLAPLKLASLMMAVWFVCTSAANYLAGIVEHTIEPYHWDLWVFLAVVAVVPGVLMIVITPLLVKMSHGKA
jgi:POT family proton-dependent oligopeptide transporter